MQTKLRVYLIAVLLLAFSLLVSVAVGAVYIKIPTIVGILMSLIPSASVVADWPASFATILLEVRLPHTLLIALTGAALAGSGAAYQGLFRNPLADPYLIGVASGAGLGAVLGLSLRWPENLLGFYLIPFAAFIGALVTVAVVYNLARVARTVPLTTLILAGVAVGAFTSSATTYLTLQSDELFYRAVSFLWGGSPVSGWEPFMAALPYMLVGFVLLTFSGHTLNVLQFGEEEARQLGLPVERAKIFVIVVASLTTAGAVAFSGIIGFVGLIVPHTIRILVGADYRHLIPLSILGGASALLVADLIARILLAPQSLPVGIVTALIGAPFFLWILRQAKRQVFW